MTLSATNPVLFLKKAKMDIRNEVIGGRAALDAAVERQWTQNSLAISRGWTCGESWRANDSVRVGRQRSSLLLAFTRSSK